VSCFYFCSALAEVVFESPATVRTIAYQAFCYCKSLTSFAVPSSVSTLGTSVFDECEKLSSVTFDAPSHLGNIPDYAFHHCDSLETLTLPDSVTAIARYALHFSSVTSIIGSGWKISGRLVLHRQKVNCCLNGPSKIRIPASVREIADGAFCWEGHLKDLSFEEGIEKIGVSAFANCVHLCDLAFPASLITIEAKAFFRCSDVRRITFAARSRLKYIRSEAFSPHAWSQVVIPASVVELDPYAFTGKIGREQVAFAGPPLFLIQNDFLLSVDSRVLFRSFSRPVGEPIGSNIEVIGAHAFEGQEYCTFAFESGTKLREIGSSAFASCDGLTECNVPESVEILGDRCFEACSHMETITFEVSSRLSKIGERAFAGCKLQSIAIPALTEEIDGSAVVDCPLIEIQVARENPNFKVEGDLVVTSDGTEIVRYFGQDGEIAVGKKVKVLRKSCFEGCKHPVHIHFEAGSEVEEIGAAALRDCDSLVSIEIPPSVRIIGEASFKGCTELESCLIAKDSSLVTIGGKAFAKCTSLRSFSIPQQVREIGRNCFRKCIHLNRLKFGSSESLKRVVGNRSLDDAREEFGEDRSATLLRIEVEDGGAGLQFSGWVSVPDDDGGSHSMLVRDLQ
jgi:hypothetical protein